MTVIVTDAGLGPETWTRGFEAEGVLDLPSDTDPATLEVPEGTEMIRVSFPSFSDGRGCTLARLLRLRGARCRLKCRAVCGGAWLGRLGGAWA